MFRSITCLAIAALMTLAASSAQAGGCHSKPVYGYSAYQPHCETYFGYSRVEAYRIYVILKQRPELIQRNPALAERLQEAFGPIAPVKQTVVAQPVAKTEAIPAPAPAPAVEAQPSTPTTPPQDLPKRDPAAAPAAPAVEAPAVQPAPEAAPAEAAVPAELAPILGAWENSTPGPAGEKITQINLGDNGIATLTVQVAGVGPVQVQRKFAVEDGNFVLVDGEEKQVLGEVVSADKDRVVLRQNGQEMTFERPANS